MKLFLTFLAGCVLAGALWVFFDSRLFPREQRIPIQPSGRSSVQLLGIANNENLSNTVPIVVEASSTIGPLDCIVFYVDGQATSAIPDISHPASAKSQITLNTASLPNGLHQIQAQATFRSPLTGSAINPFVPVFSTPVSFKVVNEISYPASQKQSTL